MKAPNQIEEHMTEYPSIASKKMPAAEAIAFMKEHQIRHLPIVESGVVVGVVSDRDLRQAGVFSDSLQLLVADVMTPDPYCVSVGVPLATVAGEMARKKHGSAVVLNKIGQVVGIFTTTDGMRVLSEILSSSAIPEMKQFTIERVLSSECL